MNITLSEILKRLRVREYETVVDVLDTLSIKYSRNEKFEISDTNYKLLKKFIRKKKGKSNLQFCDICNKKIQVNSFKKHRKKCKRNKDKSNNLFVCPICKVDIKYYKKHVFKQHKNMSFFDISKLFSLYDISNFTQKQNEILDNIKKLNIKGEKLPHIDILKLEVEILKLLSYIKTFQYKEEFMVEYHARLKIIKEKVSSSNNSLLIHKLENSFNSIPTKDKFIANSFECKICKKRVKKNLFIQHLIQNHNRSDSNMLTREMNRHGLKIKGKIEIIIRQNQEKREIAKKSKIDSKYSFINAEIKKISQLEYIEKERILNLEKIIQKTGEKVKPVEYESNIRKELEKQLKYLSNALPTQKEFFKNECNIIYITWDDIKFDNKKIRINPNKGYVRPINIEGSLKILNQIKPEYFKRVYKNDVYKLVVRKNSGIVIEYISTDIEKVKSIINQRVNEIKTGVQFKKPIRRIFQNGISKDRIISILKSDISINSFIKFPATLLTKNDNVNALLELNNGNYEECLLFLFRRKEFNYILWENINSKRAGYIFKVSHTNYVNSISQITNLVVSDLKYKRDSLFKGISFEGIDGVKNISYSCLIHDYMSNYEHKLNAIIR